MIRRIIVLAMASVFLLGFGIPTVAQAAPADNAQYVIYPTPQSLTYDDGDYILGDITVVYDPQIDAATKARLEEIAALKKLPVTQSTTAGTGTTIYVGVHGSGGPAEQAIMAAGGVDTATFDKIDGYYLSSANGVISVLGKDTDSAFYGLTTLYHVVAQIDSRTIRNFHVNDWADVASRGFIEGYYGNPWSNQDRINLMHWAGYYKLNSYFYAPKDDPKHNRNWRELYTPEEIQTKIRPLADAGNASKTRFVYALHPFMNSPIRFDQNYEADFKILTTKYGQVIDAGVRQIAVLADDAANFGGDNYVRLITDLTEWLKEKQKQYPDLKLTIPFCPVEYGGVGNQAYMQKMPPNTEIVMTGGKIWGEVSQGFTNTFTNNAKRGPYMWINWPCTDNSKRHLIMGGYADFLQPAVSPENIRGIVLNPMQQSEPSKVAIFGNAAYSWHIWDTAEEADRAWQASFAFVDHNSALRTPASDALHELSKHMINQAMDSRVRVLQESVELRDLLSGVAAKLKDNTVTSQDVAQVREQFARLAQAARTFRESGNRDLLGDIGGDYSARDANEQMAPWMDSWDDTMRAGLTYLDAVDAALAGNTPLLLTKAADAKAAFSASQSHQFFYVDHYERAEVGVQHIVPFLRDLDSWVAGRVQQVSAPDAVQTSYISNVFTKPSRGTIDNILDGDLGTVATFTDPNFLYKNDYVGVTFSKPHTVDSVRFAFEGGKNHFYYSKLQVKKAGGDWTDVSGQVFERPRNSTDPIVASGLGLTDVEGIRLIATKDNGDDLWLGIKGIDVNIPVTPAHQQYPVTAVTLEGLAVAPGSPGAVAAASDGRTDSAVWLRNADGKDNIPQNGAVVLNLGEAKPIGSIELTHGDKAAPGDRPSQAVVEVSSDGALWTKFADVRDVTEQTLTGNATAQYVRIRLLQGKNVWWRLQEMAVFAPVSTDSPKSVYTNIDNAKFSATLTDEQSTLRAGDVVLAPGKYLGLDFGNIRTIKAAEIGLSPADGITVQISNNGLEWSDVPVAQLPGKTARFVRAINTGQQDRALKVEPFVVDFLTVGPMGKLVSSTIATTSGWGDARNNGAGFDKSMATATKFGGMPVAGNDAVYDLGQNITVKSLRVYTADTEVDYIRDTTLQIGTSPTGPWTDVLTIGDGVTDTDRETAFGSINDPNKKVDSNHPNVLYYGDDNINNGQGVSGRYLRFRIDANYPNRALRFNEVVVNQGAYVSPETNAAFSSSVIEEPGHQPSYMLDGDLQTTYKPSAANGHLTYALSDPSNVQAVRLLQSGEPSRATVKARVMAASGEVREITLGTLEQSFNEFTIPADMKLLDVRLEWADKLPEISELIVLPSAPVATQETKDKLTQEIAKEPQADWTQQARASYQDLVTRAQGVLDSPQASEATVDYMLKAVQEFAKTAELKATDEQKAQLRKLVDEKVSNDEHFYTGNTYATYDLAVEAARRGLENPDLSRAQAQQLLDDLTKSRQQLAYSVFQREETERSVGDFASFKAEDYTQESYNAVVEAKKQIDQALAKDKPADAHVYTPQEFKNMREAYRQAVANLVNVVELRAQLQHEHKEADYTAQSWAPYAQARKDAESALVNGTREQVSAALQKLKETESQLVLVSKDNSALIAELEKLNPDDYTTDSYQAVKDAIAKLKDGTGTAQEATAARDALVSVVALKAKLAEISRLDPEPYTTSSFAPLAVLTSDAGQTEPLVVGIAQLLKSGTPEQIAQRIADIDAAKAALTFWAKELPGYVAGISVVDPALYTPESYAPYQAAYAHLVDLAKDPKNVSTYDYEVARAAFEKAVAALVKVETGGGASGQPNTPGSGAVVPPSGKPAGSHSGGSHLSHTGMAALPVALSAGLAVALGLALLTVRSRRNQG
ncbi:beta-N-acetylglucosaminidase domain-containing protein [Trueperella sp. LYQ143]|uniref:beta-N-acetylglucosaminidase domain-containing protein n=1 Tax=Trueperella sp. LYQ143 TaxID=3391059 RepID=UPI003983CC81